MTMKEVVEQFWKFFEESSTDEDIRQAFKSEEALLDLDVKLGAFVETHLEVRKHRQKLKDRCEALDFLDATQVMEIIKKFKSKYLDIALV